MPRVLLFSQNSHPLCYPTRSLTPSATPTSSSTTPRHSSPTRACTPARLVGAFWAAGNGTRSNMAQFIYAGKNAALTIGNVLHARHPPSLVPPLQRQKRPLRLRPSQDGLRTILQIMVDRGVHSVPTSKRCPCTN